MTGRNSERAFDPGGNAEDALFSLFIGRLLGLIAHDLNNHLAVLRESIGLADDVIGLKNIPEKKRIGELSAIVSSLDEKLNRPAALVRHMGDLSHQIEQKPADREADLVVERLLSFMNRMASQKMITLHKSFAGHPVRLLPDPLKIQFVLFTLLDNLFSALTTGGRVGIETICSGKEYLIRITAHQAPHAAPDSDPWPKDAISGVVERMGGVLHYAEGGGAITLTFPIMQSY